mgnify:CR=1 FL=1
MAYWRDSSRIPRFFGIDAKACFPLVIFLLHIKLWTFGIAFGFTIFFAVLEHYGFRDKIFFRLLRNLIIGNRRDAKAWWL